MAYRLGTTLPVMVSTSSIVNIVGATVWTLLSMSTDHCIVKPSCRTVAIRPSRYAVDPLIWAVEHHARWSSPCCPNKPEDLKDMLKDSMTHKTDNFDDNHWFTKRPYNQPQKELTTNWLTKPKFSLFSLFEIPHPCHLQAFLWWCIRTHVGEGFQQAQKKIIYPRNQGVL